MKAAAWLVLGLCLLPTLMLVALSVGDGGYREILSQERQVTLLLRSFRVSGLATALAAVWAAAVVLGIRALRGFWSAALEVLSLLPLILPSVVVAMGWVFFFGRISVNVFNETGAAFVLSMAYFPLISALLLQGLRSVDPALGAVAGLHAGPWRTFWRIWRPLLSPYLAGGAVLVFLLSLSDYGIPSALRVNVYPVEIFTQLSAYFDIPKAVAFCVPPLAAAVALIAGRHLLFPRIEETVGVRSRPLDATTSQGWVVPAAIVLVASVGLPLGMLLRTQGTWGTLSEALTIAGSQAMASLLISGVGTGMLLGAGIVLAVGLQRSGRRSRRVMEGLLALSLVIPGAVVGLGIVVMYTKGWMPVGLYRSPGSVAFAMLCRFVAFSALIVSASLSAIRARMVDAASLCGASGARTLLRVTMPLALPGIGAAAVVSFLFCLGEVSASALVNPPGFMTLPVRITSLLHFGEDRIVASLCLTLCVIVAGVVLLGLLVLNRRLELRLDADRP